MRHTCPDFENFITEIDPEHKTWKDLYKLFKAYQDQDCDDGAIAEGYSDFVAQSLARHWDRIEELASLASKDDAFRIFVLEHIDATADTGDLSLLLSNAQKKCPTTSSQLCAEIAKAALSALEF